MTRQRVAFKIQENKINKIWLRQDTDPSPLLSRTSSNKTADP